MIGEAYVDASEPYVAAPEPGRRATSGTRYTVKKGESLWSIAQTRYGSGQKWKVIAAANPSIDPDRIRLLGGMLYLSGMLIMAWNVWMTVSESKPSEALIPEPVHA